MKRFGLRPRFTLLIAILFFLLFAVVAVLLVARTASTEQRSLNEETKSFATLATKPIGDAFILYKDSGALRIRQQVQTFTDLNPDVKGVAIVDTNGTTLFSTGDEVTVSGAQAATFDPIFEPSKGVIKKAIIPLVEDYGVHRYSIVYAISDARLQSNLQRTLALAVLFGILAFVLTVLVTFKVIDIVFLSPVGTISQGARAIAQGDLSNQIELSRNDELGDLAVSLNKMANALKADIVKMHEADQLKSEFISISSHNLRTPLTAITGNIELMQSEGIPRKLEPYVADLSSAASRLDSFIADLTAISAIESGKLSVPSMRTTRLKPFFDEIATTYQLAVTQKNLDFEQAIALTDEELVMNKHLLKVAFVNLLENAIKFTQKGKISFSAVEENDQVVVKVEDTGIGIAEKELPRLFTKFHRATSMERYDYEGTGIGLYLAKLIITEHKGAISVKSIEGRGSLFIVTLPISNR